MKQKKLGIQYEVHTYDLEHLDRAIIENQNIGFIKVITNSSGSVLGATIISSQAENFVTQFVLAIKNKINLNNILKTIYAYPTMSEGSKFLAGIWKKKHKPENILNLLEKFHNWRRN